MSQLVLYRKYRSENFDEVVGQKFIVQSLRKAVEKGEVSHAYLLTGPRGIGKTSLARILARAVNCIDLQAAGNPCNVCRACQSFIKHSSMDLVEIDAASHRGIDDIRFLQEGVSFAPVEAKRKVYIIDEVHMMTKEAFNALLKTLEEPPAGSLFILATTEINKVPETIISRCQTFYLSRISEGEIAKHLIEIATQEGGELDGEAASLISQNVTGGMRDALGILDQLLILKDGKITVTDVVEIMGLVEVNLVEQLLVLLFERQNNELFSLYYLHVYEKGLDVRRLMIGIESFLRKLMLANNGLPNLMTEESQQKFKRVDSGQVVWILEELQRLKEYNFEIDSLFFELLVGKYVENFKVNNIKSDSEIKVAATVPEKVNIDNPIKSNNSVVVNQLESKVAGQSYQSKGGQSDISRASGFGINNQSSSVKERQGSSENQTKVTIDKNESVMDKVEKSQEKKLGVANNQILDEKWGEVVTQVMEGNRLLGAILKMSPVEVKDDKILLRVIYNLQKEQLEDTRAQMLIKEIIENTMQVRSDYQIEVGASQMVKQNKAEVEKEMDRQVSAMSGAQLVNDVVEIFGGEVL